MFNATRLDLIWRGSSRNVPDLEAKVLRIGTALSSAKFGQDSHANYMLSLPLSNSWKILLACLIVVISMQCACW
ncbi:hypothetical protein P692DRAFT_20383304 [Suillus brevipes Sb2]|nr:hypothetical protein P692DRAFT_20383304 [Suillus brevipes Sb2]